MLNQFVARYIATVTLVATVAFSCKPISRESALKEAVDPSNTACPSTISAAEEAALFSMISKASTELVQGKLTSLQHEQILTAALGNFQNKPTEGHANVVASGAHAVVASAFVLPVAITLATDSSFEPSISFYERLINLGPQKILPTAWNLAGTFQKPI